MKILDFKISYYNFEFLIQHVNCLEAMTPILTMTVATTKP